MGTSRAGQAAPSPQSAFHLLADDAEALFRTFRVIRRRLLGRPLGMEALPGSHLQLLNTVRRTPGLRVQEVASELGLAPNTVSTVAAHLVEGGLLERRRDQRDRRGVRFFLTDAANCQLAGWRDQRLALLATALATLSPGDRDQIEAALPALGRLVEAVHRTVGPRAVAPVRRSGARDEEGTKR
jgi:DNA-binding MarR family transcriptional regulator